MDYFGRVPAAWWHTVLRVLAGLGWVQVNAQREFALTFAGRDRYHNLERWVTYGFIEPLWTEMMQEHKADHNREDVTQMAYHIGASGRAISAVKKRLLPFMLSLLSQTEQRLTTTTQLFHRLPGRLRVGRRHSPQRSPRSNGTRLNTSPAPCAQDDNQSPSISTSSDEA